MKSSYKISVFLTFIGIMFISFGLILSPIHSQFSVTSIKTTLNANMIELRVGQDVTVTLNLGNYEDIKNGYNAYKATLVYDQNIFEKVDQDDFGSLNHWEELQYNSVTGEFVAIKKIGSKVLENVVQIKLKVKNTVPATKTTIKIKDIVTSEGKKDIFIQDKNIEVNIIKEQPNLSGNTNITTSNSNNSSSSSSYHNRGKYQANSKSVNSVGNDSLIDSKQLDDVEDLDDSKKVDKNKKNSTITKSVREVKVENSRQNYFVLFLIVVIILFILLLILYKRRKDKDNRNINMLFLFAIMGFSYILFAGTVYAAYNNFLFKGELNGDSQINYEDLKLLESHLIHKNLLPENLFENADINSDGNITVTDLTLLVQKLENTLVYEVDMTDLYFDHYYPNKKEDIVLTFNATVSYSSSIEKVVINGHEYAVSVNQQYPEQYSVVLNAGDVSGIKEFHITKALLDNGKQIEINYKQKVDVLKDKPVFDDYLVEEDINASKLYLSFNLIDFDDSLLSSSVVEIADEGGQIVQENKIVKGKNRIEIPVIEGKQYKAYIKLLYDLDTNSLSLSEDHSGREIYEKDLQLIVDYDISITNIKTYQEGTLLTSFEKNKSFQIAFESTNRSIYEPTIVKVNGKEYAITKQNDQYVATIDGIKQLGKQEVEIEKLQLSNGKKFEFKDQYKVTVNILRQKPTIDDFKTLENVKDSNLKMEFSLQDEDHAIKSGVVILYDQAGSELSREILTSDDLQSKDKITKLLKTSISSSYKVKIEVQYTQTGKDEDLVSVILLEKDVPAEARVIINKILTNQIYFEKEGVVTLTYKIVTNKKQEISKILINSSECIVKKLANGEYEVSYVLDKTSGIKELETSKIIFSDNTFTTVDKRVKVEVLKDIPSIQNIEQIDHINDSEVTMKFDVVDTEHSFLFGEVVMTNTNDQSVVRKEIKPGENRLTFSVVELVDYQFAVYVNYDRDTNSLEGTKEEDNVFKNQLLDTRKINLISDYQLRVSDIKTYSSVETRYFTKNEDIILDFASSNISTFEPVSATINGKDYSITKVGSRYRATIAGIGTSGVKSITIDKIKLSNTKVIDLTQNNVVQVEILKDKPVALEFSYRKTNDNKVNITFTLKDVDQAFISGSYQLMAGANVIAEGSLKEGNNQVEVGLNSGIDEYSFVVKASYDLDCNPIDQNNHYVNVPLLNEKINASIDAIELKDITSTELYYKNEKIDSLDISKGMPSDLDNYYVKINMSSLPTYYANVKSIEKDSKTNLVHIVIDQTDFIQYHYGSKGYEKNNVYSFPIPYRDADGYHSIITSASDLFAKINSDPKGNFKLTEDLDASGISTVTAINEFRGTLDGNGHKIINLPTALFSSLNGATIKNLVIEDAKITNNSKGILANSMTGKTVVQNTYVINSSLSNNQSQVGAFAGNITNATIKESAAISVNIRASNTVGGITGQMSSGSIVENCYATGIIEGTISHGLGARVGGITGWDSGNKIEKCYTNVTIKSVSRTGNGGLIGGPSGGSPLVKDSVSLGGGTASRISGFGTVSKMENVYEYSKSNSATNITGESSPIKSIDNIYDYSFYKEVLKFDESVWNLSLIKYNKLPTLKDDPMPNTIDLYEAEENKNNIPNYKELRLNKDYKADKEILYYNFARLTPFADTRNWLDSANAYNGNSKFTLQKIKFILPLTHDNHLVLGIQEADVNQIKKIRVVYENEESEVFNVQYTKTIEGLVSIYQLENTNFEYQYDDYISTIDNTLVDRIVGMINEYDYATKIASVTDEDESRLYVDFYNESVKNNLRNVVVAYLLADEDIPTYNHNQMLKTVVDQKFTEENLIKFLYAYNYYEKWYRIDLDGIKVSDLLFFSGRYFHQDLNPTYLINSVVNTNTNTNNRATNNTVSFYNSFIQGKTTMSLPNFLAYLFKTLNDYDDPSDWVKDHFKGILYEQEATGSYSKDIIYRIWPIMSRSHTHVILPILSAPQEDMYMISCPSQFVIGSMNRYSTYLNKDGNERARMLDAIKSYSERLGLFYGTSAGFIPNAVTRLNSSRVNAQYDTRFYFPASTKADAGTQSAGTTRDPVMKWVYEAIGGAWAAANGSGAYANGYNVWWVVDCALGGDRAVHVFTHETAHNQDGGYFYSGNGRRPQTGAESHADGVIAQDIGAVSSIFNLTKNFGLESDYATNLTTERINTQEKIDSYYREMYDTKYVLEYLAAKAFLKLTPEEQAKVAIQMQHNTTGANYTTKYVRLTADDFRKMNLKTVEDLWDNQLALRGTGTSPHTWNGRYGYDSFFWLDFYIPNNPNGAPDVNTFKNTGYEMLGYAGYDKGFINYMSGRSANDLVALRKITGDDTMTWKKYKLSRYEKVEKNLNQIKYYDLEELLTLYETALKNDAQNGNLNTSVAVTRLYYGIIKRATNDFVTGGIYHSPEPVSITSAQQLVDLVNRNPYGTYRIDADLDFSNIESVTGKTYYIENRFLGSLDGNGHKLKGMKYTLFNSIVYGVIKNLTIDHPDYVDDVNSYLAVSGKNFATTNINVEKATINIPNIKSKSGMYFTLGDNSYTTRKTELKTTSDFLAIAKSDVSRKKEYILVNDLDFTNIDRIGSPIVSGVFSGSIDGNGHTISNAKDVLFNSITGTVKNIKVENSVVTSGSAKGIFANSIQNGTIEGISINHSSIVNNTNQVGGLSGVITSSTINKISLTDITVKSNNTIGGLAGQINSTSVSNILVTGTITGTASHSLGSRAGGITGWLSNGSSIHYSVTKAEVNGSNKTGNGGLIGGPNSGNCIITNSISLSTGTKSYRIAGFNTLNAVTNVYEYALSNSSTNINANNNTKVLSATDRDIKTASFYTNSVKLDSHVWNFNVVSSGGVPKLINVTSN